MKLTGPSTLLADAPLDFCFCSWSPVQQGASYQQQLSCRPADLFQSLPDMVNPCKARGFLRSEAEALGWDIRNSWAWLADAACVWAVDAECWEHRELKCRLIKVTMENCSQIHSDSLSLGLNATTYYGKNMFFSFSFVGRCSLVSPRARCLSIYK